jgi:hypothetical protein
MLQPQRVEPGLGDERDEAKNCRDRIDERDENAHRQGRKYRGNCHRMASGDSPRRYGRARFRGICASICLSSTWFSVAAEAAASAITALAQARVPKGGTSPLASSVPTMAVKVMSAITLGFVSSK